VNLLPLEFSVVNWPLNNKHGLRAWLTGGFMLLSIMNKL